MNILRTDASSVGKSYPFAVLYSENCNRVKAEPSAGCAVLYSLSPWDESLSLLKQHDLAQKGFLWRELPGVPGESITSPESVTAVPENRLSIKQLISKDLKTPIEVLVESDEDKFIATTEEIPVLYGSGNTANKAIEMLLAEIESLYEDLLKDDDFTQDWLEIRERLKQIIA